MQVSERSDLNDLSSSPHLDLPYVQCWRSDTDTSYTEQSLLSSVLPMVGFAPQKIQFQRGFVDDLLRILRILRLSRRQLEVDRN
jgi:hypothetical protein